MLWWRLPKCLSQIDNFYKKIDLPKLAKFENRNFYAKMLQTFVGIFEARLVELPNCGLTK